MGIALLFAAPVFSEKSEHCIKWLFIANGIIGIAFLIGEAAGVYIVNILSSFVWGILFLIATILLAMRFGDLKKHKMPFILAIIKIFSLKLFMNPLYPKFEELDGLNGAKRLEPA